MPSERNVPIVVERRGVLSENLSRWMENAKLSPREVAERTGLEETIVCDVLRGEIPRPLLGVLDRLARGLKVDRDTLLSTAVPASRRSFDRRTNPIVAEVIAAHPRLFDDWAPADYDELYSRFGTGGELTYVGVLACARAMNRRRELCAKLALLLETDHAEGIVRTIEQAYELNSASVF
ncbi:MAG: helix-turn-helix domain-containing protein [Planctomycetia bacterium]|nr:helix-turn-helix domain-containing protein [Planctomycetia bacterium]